jgi:hypothetical protein
MQLNKSKGKRWISVEAGLCERSLVGFQAAAWGQSLLKEECPGAGGLQPQPIEAMGYASSE